MPEPTPPDRAAPACTIASDLLAMIARIRRDGTLDWMVCWKAEELERLAMFAVSAKNDLAQRATPPATPSAAAIEEGVRAAGDLWGDGAEFDDAVRCGIGVAVGLAQDARPAPLTEVPGTRNTGSDSVGEVRVQSSPASQRSSDLPRLTGERAEVSPK